MLVQILNTRFKERDIINLFKNYDDDTLIEEIQGLNIYYKKRVIDTANFLISRYSFYMERKKLFLYLMSLVNKDKKTVILGHSVMFALSKQKEQELQKELYANNINNIDYLDMS